MAGIHFIILKVNGIDVSQMSNEEAIQLFLKASEPILVEVRRRSYNLESIGSVESTNAYISNDSSHQNELNCSKRQSPTISHFTTTAIPAKNQDLLGGSSATVDSLKFHSLVFSSKFNAVGDAIPAKHINNESLPACSARNTTYSASTSSYHLSNTYNTDDFFNQIADQLGHTSISAVTSPTKIICQKSSTSSPFREDKLKVETEPPQTREKNLVSIATQTEHFTTNILFGGSSVLNADHMIENEHNLFGECIAPEIDIEEITLRKLDTNERLGLTVCYSSGGGNGSESDDTDTCTEVYISDIVPDSIAGRDGRLRQGDQILQVNGKDVSNREETETLIAENNNAVTLLVSRYLYGDDDEFNEQVDFYDDDESNLAYPNSFLDKYILSEHLSKSAKNSHNTTPDRIASVEDLRKIEPNSKVSSVLDKSTSSNDALLPATSQITSKDPLNHQNIRAHLEQVTQEIAILDSRVENMMSQHIKPVKNIETSKQSESPNTKSILKVLDYDTEHIYETIPEDSESEPFYCSPYEEHSEHHTRIEQWLGLQDKAQDVSIEHKINNLQQKQQNISQTHESVNNWSKVKTGTIQSTNSSAGDDHENSSSAYNTGGSCNSNTMTPLTLEFNTSCRERDQQSGSSLFLCSAKNAVSPLRETSIQQRTPTLDFPESIKSSYRFPKEKISSPIHSSKCSQIAINKQKPFALTQKSDISKFNNQTTPISVTNTMYTNVANLQQTMLLQQQLFRQALIHQRIPGNTTIPCPQFTAPNLSQYHFVSSQEVSTVKLNTHSSDDHMVWKVKRRQDGTRYIVRRPARTRFLRNRALRISAERNDQTTEDDTISEIKTGRYWTKEERKKHIERARERRQRQQIIITNKNNECLPTELPSGAQSSAPTKNNELNQPKILQAPHSLNTFNAKVQQHGTPTGQNTTKKIVKKINNIPIEITTTSSGTGALKQTTTNGSKTAGLLSVTTV